ncbi:MAG: protein BatD [Saprospiraceae bacterium]|nr:protein BatD [Saprospiraceae bacterium]
MANKIKHLVWYTLTLTSILCHTLYAQSVKFYLQTDREKVEVGETFMLEAVLENADATNIQMPDLKSFKVVQGPSTSSSITIINGKRSASVSYRYMLLAVSKGIYSIGPASVRINSKEIKSNIIRLNVVDASKVKAYNGLDDNNQTMIRMEVSEEKAYIGQQIVVSYVLYTRQNLESYQLLNEPKFDSFYAVPLNDFKEQPQRKTLNGKEYHRQVLKKVILFPQKVGNYNFGPVNVTLDIPVDNGRSSFFFRDVKKEQTKTNSLRIDVKPLPVPAPESFSGGVGDFTMRTTIQKNTVTTDESVIIRMLVEGNGDSKIVQAPQWSKIPGLESYEPSTIRDETFDKGDKIKMIKEFEYILVPNKDTVYNLSPEFSYFSTLTGKYETITSGPMRLNVVKGSGKSLPSTKQDTIQLSPMAEDLNPIDYQSAPFFGSSRYFGIVGGIFCLTLLGIFYKKRKQEKAELAGRIAQSSIQIALKNLERASHYKSEHNAVAFYEELSFALTGYIQKKFEIPNINLSIQSVSDSLRSSQIADDLVEEYGAIMNKCELARFAGKYEDMEGLYDRATRFIMKTEGL